MSRNRLGLFLGVFLLGVVLAACTEPSSNTSSVEGLASEAGTVEDSASTYREAPSFARPTLDGDKLALSDLRGQVVILNFWATWCGPCRAEIPGLVALHQTWKDKGVRVVGVSVDEKGEPVVRPFVEELEVTYPIVVDPRMEVARAYGGHYALPTTFVIDRQGRIRQRFMRVVHPEDLRPVIASLVR